MVGEYCFLICPTGTVRGDLSTDLAELREWRRTYDRIKPLHRFLQNLIIPSVLPPELARERIRKAPIQECRTTRPASPRRDLLNLQYRRQRDYLVRNQVDCAATGVAEDKAVPDFEPMRV